MPHRGASKIAVIVAVLFCGLVAVGVVGPMLMAHVETEDRPHLVRLRELSNAFTLYYKRFGYYPALTDMHSPAVKTIGQARHPGGQSAVLALKLLIDTGITDNPLDFFSARADRPSDKRLAAMRATAAKPLAREDPNWGQGFATTWAYDPGHSPLHGNTVFFGDRQADAMALGLGVTCVLTCEQVAKQIDGGGPDRTFGAERFVIESHAAHSDTTALDDIYADDSAVLSFRDSFLQSDGAEKEP